MKLQLLRFAEYVTDKFNERTYTAHIRVLLDVSKASETFWTTGLTQLEYQSQAPSCSIIPY
jgi:hypothetical protein